ncbi:hypothetical protein P171DRAFT_235172 [Karstenula rhodostoma CBS 690.94]|uniref:Uncharacterized protein n=1 Tax=Karstenula rhodostoma CBS 690.94 TaxID=1392251 RepID=A0A9P4UDL0_9PLEO|nr:hypothetical protein P171DRAFT_235172 [Karstenula rhodostoma CBS 690.94]
MKYIRKRGVIRKVCAIENKDLNGTKSRPVHEAVHTSKLSRDVPKDADCTGPGNRAVTKAHSGNARTRRTKRRWPRCCLSSFEVRPRGLVRIRDWRKRRFACCILHDTFTTTCCFDLAERNHNVLALQMFSVSRSGIWYSPVTFESSCFSMFQVHRSTIESPMLPSSTLQNQGLNKAGAGVSSFVASMIRD